MKLLIIDFSNFLFRAFHAVGDLRTSDGRPSGAIFSTVSMIDRLVRKYPDYYVACIADYGSKNFRHELDSKYKANRPPMLEDLAVQIPTIHQLIQAYGLPMVSIAGVEADDVIATYVKIAKKEKWQIIIASSDKDLMQLVDETATVYDSMKDRHYDINGVQEKFGITPSQIADYLALIGDTSDNIRGVEKVGPKTAAKWLNAWDTLDNIVAAAGTIKGVVGENLRQSIENDSLQLARKLVALKEDVQDIPDLSTFARQAPDFTLWDNLCLSFELNQLKNRLHTSIQAVAVNRPPVDIINQAQQLMEWCEAIRAQKYCAIDTETIGEPPSQAVMVGFSLALNSEKSAYVPLQHTDNSEPQIEKATAIKLLKSIMEDPTIVKILHNGKYDWHVLLTAGIEIQGIIEDTKIAAYVDNALADSTMGALALTRLGVATIPFKSLVDGKTVPNFAAVPIKTAADYAGEDAYITCRLFETLTSKFDSDAQWIYNQIDRPLMPILAKMERTGMCIDVAALNTLSHELHEKISHLESEAFECAGEIFNLSSPKQVAEILFDKIGATVLRKTKNKARSTDEKTLEKLSHDFPLAAILLKHRGFNKLVNTYTDRLPELIHPHTGRVHTQFSQTTVFTGRLSSSAPNLQNIPIRSKEGRLIRQAFIADKGKKIISADYSQIELRVMAIMANDSAMLSAFAKGDDIHQQTAAEIFSMPLENVNQEQRRAAKAINFGLIYGMSAFGLAQNINITKNQADIYIDRYFSRYPDIANFMQKTRQEAPNQGFVKTLHHRRIPLSLPHINKSGIERIAINAPIQGSAADIVKLAMIAIHQWLLKHNMSSRMILQVHDEIVIEATIDEVDTIIEHLPQLMNVIDLPIDLDVNIHYGDNWNEAH